MIQDRTADPDNLKTISVAAFLMEITNSQDHEESESQHSSQLPDQVNYGTQPEERIESFVDYDWDQDQKIKYLCDENGIHQV